MKGRIKGHCTSELATKLQYTLCTYIRKLTEMIKLTEMVTR